MNAAPNYQRPRLAWIKRRARRLQIFYGVARRIAIWDAWVEYIQFTGDRSALPLRAVEGGRHG